MLSYGNVALRAVMELGIVCGFGYWGFHTGRTVRTRLLLGLGVPVLGFGLWGLLDFRQMGAAGEWLRLVEELVISALAAVAWYAAGQHAIAWLLLLASLLHHVLVYALGDRLLRR